jgi:transposase
LAIKQKSHEKLNPENIGRVIEALEADNPITKKEACEMLNIRYNTTRLQRIFDDFNDMQDYRERRKAQNKGKAASRDEIKTVVTSYLEGFNISQIATSIYRSPSFVKNIVERVGVPQKLAESDYEGIRESMLPEQCVADEFEVGEKIWAVRQNYPALVEKELSPEGAEERGYKLYLCHTIECSQEDLKGTYFPHLSFAGKQYPLATYDMGKLQHLQKYL